MTVFSVAFYALALLLVAEQLHARPGNPTTPNSVKCEYNGKIYDPGEEVWKDKCSVAICGSDGIVQANDLGCISN